MNKHEMKLYRLHLLLSNFGLNFPELLLAKDNGSHLVEHPLLFLSNVESAMIRYSLLVSYFYIPNFSFFNTKEF